MPGTPGPKGSPACVPLPSPTQRMGALHQGEPLRSHELHSRRPAGDDGANRRAHRHDRVRCRSVRGRLPRSVRRCEGRRGRILTLHRPGGGTLRHHGELHRPGDNAHAPRPPPTTRAHPRNRSGRTSCSRGTSSGAGVNPGTRRVCVVFLAGPMAAWITGQTYPVNGGYTLSSEPRGRGADPTTSRLRQRERAVAAARRAP